MNDLPGPFPEPVGAAEIRRMRQHLLQLGYSPVPVQTGGKACIFRGWPARAAAGDFTADDFPISREHMSTGMSCTGLRAIDLDIDDEAVLKAVCAAAGAAGLLQPAPTRYREGSPRCLLVFRAAEGAPGKRTADGDLGKIEVLGHGQQFVADGRHPSGFPYRWRADEPFPACLPPRDELPAITEEQISRLFDVVAPIIGAESRTMETTERASHGSNPEKEAPIGDVEAALASIPNPDLPWGDWRKIGLATWAATGGSGEGRQAWRAWSARSGKHDDGRLEEAWAEIDRSPPGRIGFGTLVFEARKMQPDWSPPSRRGAGENAATAAFAAVPMRAAAVVGAGEALSIPGFPPVVVPAAPALPLLLAADIHPVLDSAEIVQGLIGENSAVLIFGESNSGKTFWTVDLALSVAAGLPWNGRRVERSGVVYACLEGGNTFRNRVVAWMAARLIDPKSLSFAAIPASLNLLDPSVDTPRLIAAVRVAAARMNVPVRLVVVDTLSRALAGGNENAPDAMGCLIGNTDRIRAETRCTVVFVHHSGKDSARGARGHSLLRAAVDTEIELVDSQDGRTATVVKQRDFAKGGVFGFRLNVLPLGVNRYGEPVSSCVVEHIPPVALPGIRLKPLPAQARIALDALRDAAAEQGEPLPLGGGFPGAPTRGVKREAWRAAAHAALGHLSTDTRRRAFNRAVEELAARKLIGTHQGFVWPAPDASADTAVRPDGPDHGAFASAAGAPERAGLAGT